MEIDYYYIKIFLSPLLGFSLAILLMKCCCKRHCFSRASASVPQRRDTPIYFIPIPVNDENFDRNSVSSLDAFAPPSYDSVISGVPPPPYSEMKLSGPEEEPPVYTEITSPQHTQNT